MGVVRKTGNEPSTFRFATQCLIKGTDSISLHGDRTPILQAEANMTTYILPAATAHKAFIFFLNKNLTTKPRVF
jgi:hypothetical protein